MKPSIVILSTRYDRMKSGVGGGMTDIQLISIGIAAFIFVAVVVKLQSRTKESPQSLTAGKSLSYFGPNEIETFVRDHVTDIGRTAFPDNPDVQWLVHGFTHRPEFVLAEVEPQPDEVGYPRFQLGFVSIRGEAPQHIATYCLEDGEYTLLSTARGAPRNLPMHLVS